MTHVKNPKVKNAIKQFLNQAGMFKDDPAMYERLLTALGEVYDLGFIDGGNEMREIWGRQRLLVKKIKDL